MSSKILVEQVLTGKLGESKESFKKNILGIIKYKLNERKEMVAKEFFNK